MKRKSTIALGAVFALIMGSLIFGVSSSFAYQGDPTKQGPNYTPEREAAMDKAFESKNYDDWKKLMESVQGNGQKRVLTVVNKDNFSKFVDAHNLAEQGKTAEANAIRSELGLGNGSGMRGNSNGTRGQNNNGNFVDSNNDGMCDHN
jgi:hypothetical protein